MRYTLLLSCSLSIATFYSGAQAPAVMPITENQYSASIVRTRDGIPHIYADTLSGIGFGNGYAQAQDNVCLIADRYVHIRGERSKYFGADLNEKNDGLNFYSDYVAKTLHDHGQAQARFEQLSENSQQLIEGYVRGYNKYLLQVKQTKTGTCIDEPWVKSISTADVLGYLNSISIFAGAEGWGEELVSAAPPSNESKFAVNMRPNEKKAPVLGSNAWAIGKANAKGSQSILLGNPHFPLEGYYKFWQVHHVMKDELDVMGASIVGFPGIVNIGFNNRVAWSHTYSTANKVVIYEMSTSEKNPMTYVVDDKKYPVKQRNEVIEVKEGNQLVKHQVPVYTTHLGPIIESDFFSWDKQRFFVLNDVNLHNPDLIDHWLALNKASSVEEVTQSFEQYNGLVFNNTIASDAKGKAAFIADNSVHQITEEAANLATSVEKYQAYLATTDHLVLPSSSSDYILGDKVAIAQLPVLIRDDYVQNSNDTHWMSNPEAPLEGYSPLFGYEGTEVNFRTRQAIQSIKSFLKDDGKISTDEVTSILFKNESYFFQLIEKDLNKTCQVHAETSPGLKKACGLIANFDNRQYLSSPGSVLMREFLYHLDYESLARGEFDPAHPITTPYGLKQHDEVIETLKYSISLLETAGIDIAASLNEHQYATPYLGFQNRPLYPGLIDEEGGFNWVANWTWNNSRIEQTSENELVSDTGLTAQGYEIKMGSSWIMAVTFKDGRVHPSGLLVTPQSSNPLQQAVHKDTHIYMSGKGMRPLPFDKNNINSNRISSTYIKN